MAVPKRKISKSKKRMRRSHLAISARTTIHCSRCNTVKLPHAICEHCGYYRGKPVAPVEELGI